MKMRHTIRKLRTAVHGKVLMPAVYCIMRDERFKILRDFIERDGWTAAQVREHQARRLTSLFGVCRQHNPYWSRKFDQYGLNPHGSDPFTELAKLPILTKDELRANWKGMRSTHLSDREVVHVSTSGSTGMPVNIYHSRHYCCVDAAMLLRGMAWMGIEPGEPQLGVVIHSGQLITPTKAFLRRLRLAVSRGMVIDALVISKETTGRRIAAAAKWRPSLVWGYTTAVVTIAKMARELGITWSGIRAVSTTAECLFDEDRTLLGDVFGAPVYDRYGSREVSGITMQCHKGNHHIFADANIVEFLPLPETPPQHNAIVVTPLENEAMPLFRYRNGDLASGVAGACACGRELPLMTACKGRICGNFLLKDGRLINGAYFMPFFFYQEGVVSYQVHQTAVDHIDLYVVPDVMFTEERHDYLRRCCQRMISELNNQFEVTLHLVDEIPKTPGGKHLYTISDVLKSM
jgi:phenylacetate-CoA ligase